MADLRVNVAGVEFSNPLIAASGTFGFGHEYNEFYPLSALGGISCKGITIKERPGNPPPRVTETPGGMLNAVGLQNPGVDHFIEHDLPWLAEQGAKIIANVAGNAPEDYCATVEKLNDTCVDMVELNISCPNVKQGGVQFGTTTEGVYGITSEVRKHCKKPLMVKLSPNVTDISEMAVAAESAGADALSMINTLTGMRIDIRTRRPIIRNNTGGLSGGAARGLADGVAGQPKGENPHRGPGRHLHLAGRRGNALGWGYCPADWHGAVHRSLRSSQDCRGLVPLYGRKRHPEPV